MRTTTKTVLGAGLALGTYLVATGGNLDYRDALAERRSDAEIMTLAHERELDRYKAENLRDYDDPNLGRFILQLAQDPQDREEVIVGTMEGGDSVVGAVHRTFWGRIISPEFGEDCLYGSIFMPEGPITESIEGGQDDAPRLITEGDGTVTVYSASTQVEQLRFTVDENNVLQPHGQYTQDKLAQYGCAPWHEDTDMHPGPAA